MDSVLRIDELCRNICYHCSTSTLASLAGTGSLFLESALDTLWANANLIDIVLLLPSDVLRHECDVSGTSDMFLRRPLQYSPDLNRVMFYAKRIRSLGFTTIQSSQRGKTQKLRISDSVISALLMAGQELHSNQRSFLWKLFPRLRDIHISVTPHCYSSPAQQNDFWQCAMLLAHDSLHSICLDNMDISIAQEPLDSFLRSVSSTCPNLSILRIDPSFYRRSRLSFDVRRSLSVILRNLKQLEEVEWVTEEVEDLVQLAELPTLRRLDFGYVPREVKVGLPPGSFGALCKLRLRAHPDACQSIMTAIQSYVLADLQVQLHQVQIAEQWAGIVTALITRPAATSGSLIHLELEDMTNHAHNGGTFTPLFRLKSLRSLSIKIGYKIAFRDEHFDVLTSSCTDLSRLVLNCNSAPSCGLTLRGVTMLARLPHISEVQISFDGSKVPDFSSGDPRCRGWTTNSDCKLTSIHVGASLIEDPMSLAEVFRRFFPYLRNINVTCSLGSMEKMNRWTEVQRLIQYK